MAEHEESQKQSSRKPIAKFEMRGVHGSLWCNQGEKGDVYTVSLDRRYQKNGNWHTSHSFRADQIPAVLEILAAAQEMARQEIQKRGKSQVNDQETEKGLRVSR